MDVAELAKDLEVPPSAVLEACAALGIEGAWAGSQVSAVDEVRLRARLATGVGAEEASAPAVVTEADLDVAEPDAAEPDAAEEATTDGAADADEATLAPVGAGSAPAEEAASSGGDPAPLPPTAVGSHPGLVEEFQETEAARRKDEELAGLGRRGPIAGGVAGPDGSVPTVEHDISRHLPDPDADRHLDPAIRPALVAVGLAVVAAVAGNAVENPWIILAFWVLLAVSLVAALVSANRARYRITTHPERRAGLPLAVGALVAAVLGTAVFAGAIVTVVSSEPAADAPAGLGDFASVKRMRWGYQRLGVIADTGWERPAKDAGTCWKAAVDPPKEPRRDHRDEVGGDRVSCSRPHAFEVVRVIAVNRDADAPYPGADELRAIGAQRCAEDLADLPAGARAVFELPDREGWEAGDHDVACVVAAQRSAPLGS